MKTAETSENNRKDALYFLDLKNCKENKFYSLKQYMYLKFEMIF